MEKRGAKENGTESKGDKLFNVSDLVDNDTHLNLKCLHCKRCGSKIVKDAVARLIENRKVRRLLIRVGRGIGCAGVPLSILLSQILTGLVLVIEPLEST